MCGGGWNHVDRVSYSFSYLNCERFLVVIRGDVYLQWQIALLDVVALRLHVPQLLQRITCITDQLSNKNLEKTWEIFFFKISTT